MSLTIPRRPVDITAATHERNRRHFSSEIISVKISNPVERLVDSKPPDCDISSKILSILVSLLISISFTGRPGSIMKSTLEDGYKILTYYEKIFSSFV